MPLEVSTYAVLFELYILCIYVSHSKLALHNNYQLSRNNERYLEWV